MDNLWSCLIFQKMLKNVGFIMRRSSAPSFSSVNKRNKLSVSQNGSSGASITTAGGDVASIPARVQETSSSSIQPRRAVGDILNIIRATGGVPSAPTPRGPDDVVPQRKTCDDNVAVSDPSKRYFEVLWCKKSARKHKKWEGDGVLEAHQRQMVLRDLTNSVLAQASGCKNVDLENLSDGDVVSVGGKEVEIQRCLTAAERGQLVVPAATPTEDAATCQHVPAPRVRTCPSTTSSGGGRRFVSPVVGGPLQTVIQGRVPAPRFDPTAPGAFLLPQPSQQYQWQHNSVGCPVVEVVVDPHLARRLRPHQRLGVSFIYSCVMGYGSVGRGVILADEMGLGKTLQCLTVVWTMLRQGPFGGDPVLSRVLIVTPSSLVNNWVKESNKWLGRERLTVYAVDKDHSVQAFISSRLSSVMVISYEMLVRYVEDVKLCQFEMLICDEGHRLKNINIKISTALRSLDCSRRVLLTGTPVQNDLKEFFALSQFVNPKALGSYAEFHSQFEESIVRGRQPDASAAELEEGRQRARQLADITDQFVLRRTQEVIDQYLPPKVETTVFCRASPLQLQLYRSLVASRALQLQLSAPAAGGRHMQPLVYISLLKKLCNHPVLLAAAADEASVPDDVDLHFPSDFHSCRASPSDSGKLAVVAAILDSLQSASARPDKIVLISYYTQTLDLLATLCADMELSTLRLDGSTPVGQRQSLVDRFNSPYGTEVVFLLSAKAGGVGLNLTAASRILLYDIDWNPANDLQALARVWRDGQRNMARIYRLITAGTIEEKIYQRQMSKQGLSSAILSPLMDSSASSQFSRDDLRDLFRLDEGVSCSTHTLLQCGCDTAGGATYTLPSATSSLSSDLQQLPRATSCNATESPPRPCQLGLDEPSTVSAAVTIDQLLAWQHFSTPADPLAIQDEGLTGAGDWITFLFRCVTDVNQ